MPNFEFQFDPNNIEGSLSSLMDYLKWFNAHLDETNVKYLAWGDSIVDNVDSTHKLKLKFYIPDGVMKVQKLTLNFSVEAFRAYETGAASGGGSTTTSAGGSLDYDAVTYGAQWTGVTDFITGSDFTGKMSTPSVDSDFESHQHDVVIEGHFHALDPTKTEHTHNITIPDHAHAIDYGIYESTLAAGCMVYVDGVLRLSNGGIGYSTDQANLDLTQWVSTAGWHTIEISSAQLGRINAAYFIQVYVGNNGI